MSFGCTDPTADRPEFRIESESVFLARLARLASDWELQR